MHKIIEDAITGFVIKKDDIYGKILFELDKEKSMIIELIGKTGSGKFQILNKIYAKLLKNKIK